MQRIEHLLYIAEYKRRQSAPGVKITRRILAVTAATRLPIASVIARLNGRSRRVFGHSSKAIVAGFLSAFFLTFCSSFGQTFFIALSADQIRPDYGLSHGGFGGVYMVATLASAATLPFIGRIVDHISVANTLLIIMPALALACILMAFSSHMALLLLALYVLRLFGQGMMTHTAITALGKWYRAKRGRAVSIATLGHQLGEAILPIGFALMLVILDWRSIWLLSAAFLLIIALPIGYQSMKIERIPRGVITPQTEEEGPSWTRQEVLRDPLFYLVLMGVLGPSFIGTSIFFHQVYLIVDLKDWSREGFAFGFVIMAITNSICGLIAGILVDQYSARKLLPFFMVPLALACFVFAWAEALAMAYLAMALLGIASGFAFTLFGAYWPEVYGTQYLGAIRSVTVAAMVLSSAIGPGLTGALIDYGMAFPTQLWFMGIYCFAACLVLFVASRKVMERQQIAALSP